MSYHENEFPDPDNIPDYVKAYIDRQVEARLQAERISREDKRLTIKAVLSRFRELLKEAYGVEHWKELIGIIFQELFGDDNTRLDNMFTSSNDPDEQEQDHFRYSRNVSNFGDEIDGWDNNEDIDEYEDAEDY